MEGVECFHVDLLHMKAGSMKSKMRREERVALFPREEMFVEPDRLAVRSRISGSATGERSGSKPKVKVDLLQGAHHALRRDGCGVD